MKSSAKDDLMRKYLAGESTLEEEEKLFNPGDQRTGIEAWSTYVNQNRKKTPAGLADSIWANIKARDRRKQRFLVGLYGIAASVALCIAVLVYKTDNKNTDYAEKEALLNEALSLLSKEPNPDGNQRIIYEDDMVIIYSASE